MYVAIHCSRTDLKRQGLEGVVPIPKKRTTFNSWIQSKGTGVTNRGNPQFIPAREQPSKEQTKKLIGLALGTAAKATMENHYYTINGDI